MTEQRQRRNDAIVLAHSRRFHDGLSQPPHPAPTLLKLMAFRMARTAIPLMLDEKYRDVTYYRDKGWYESDYFYRVRLSPLKRAAGKVFDYPGARSAKR